MSPGYGGYQTATPPSYYKTISNPTTSYYTDAPNYYTEKAKYYGPKYYSAPSYYQTKVSDYTKVPEY
jgi:hypothetical protein